MTCTGIASPGLMTVPTLGGLTAVNGAAGSVTEVTRTGVVPLLTMSSTSGLKIPTGTFRISMPSCSLITNDRAGALATSPVLVPLPTSGTEVGTEDALVVNDTAPSAPMAAVGAYVTAARSTSPLFRVTGNVTLAGWPPGWVRVTWPRVNGGV